LLAELLDILLDPAAAQTRFGNVLRDLVEHGRRGSLTASFTSEEAVRLLSRTWSQRLVEGGDDERWRPASSVPTLHDALLALQLLEHSLRPLAHPPVRANVLHASTNGLGVLPALVSAWHHGTPILLSEHGIYLREQYLDSRQRPFRWPVKALHLNLLRRVSAQGYHEAAMVTSCNLYNQRWQERLGAGRSTVRTVYNGVDPAGFPALSGEPEAPTVVWVGRIDPIKDIETLLNAFCLVRKEMPTARLRLYGSAPPGRESYLERCRQLAAELGIADAATFEGRTEDLGHAYGSGHVTVLSSVSEGLPYTVIEAMAFGRPCVATDVGGVREVIGDTGIVVTPRDAEALALACLTLLRDRQRRQRLALRARARALELFRLDQMVAAFDDMYRALGSGSDASPDEDSALAAVAA
jgi:glycosyltransferase involved in cell wall biosynthesis